MFWRLKKTPLFTHEKILFVRLNRYEQQFSQDRQPEMSCVSSELPQESSAS